MDSWLGKALSEAWKAATIWDYDVGIDQVEEDDMIDLQVGNFHDVTPRNMRTQLWLSALLQKGVGTAAEQDYDYYLRTGLVPDVFQEIKKDIDRTAVTKPHKVSHQSQGYDLTSNEGKTALAHVLAAYAAFDTEVGYCQGMNFLAALLLSYLPQEAQAFGAMVMLMREKNLRDMYKTDMGLLQVRLWQVGRLLPPRISHHLEAHGALPVLYASSWLLTCFSADFPLSFAARVMDAVLSSAMPEPMMKVAVVLLQSCEGDLLAMNDMEYMVDFLRKVVPRWPRDKLQAVLDKSLGTPWTPRELSILQQTSGAESVSDAVQRVNAIHSHGGDADHAALEGSIASGSAQPGDSTTAASPLGASKADGDGGQVTVQSSAGAVLRVPALPSPPREGGAAGAGAKPGLRWAKGAQQAAKAQQEQQSAGTTSSSTLWGDIVARLSGGSESGTAVASGVAGATHVADFLDFTGHSSEDLPSSPMLSMAPFSLQSFDPFGCMSNPRNIIDTSPGPQSHDNQSQPATPNSLPIPLNDATLLIDPATHAAASSSTAAANKGGATAVHSMPQALLVGLEGLMLEGEDESVQDPMPELLLGVPNAAVGGASMARPTPTMSANGTDLVWQNQDDDFGEMTGPQSHTDTPTQHARLAPRSPATQAQLQSLQPPEKPGATAGNTSLVHDLIMFSPAGDRSAAAARVHRPQPRTTYGGSAVVTAETHLHRNLEAFRRHSDAKPAILSPTIAAGARASASHGGAGDVARRHTFGAVLDTHEGGASKPGHAQKRETDFSELYLHVRSGKERQTLH